VAFPELAEFPIAAIKKTGYEAVWRGEKSWNGVAILGRGGEPVLTRTGLPGDPADAQSRYIEAAVNGVLVATLYAPNGNPQPGPKFKYKLAWMRRLLSHAAELYALDAPVVLAGDFNVVPTDADIYPTKSYARTRLCSLNLGPCLVAFLIRAGSMRSARCILTSRCTRSGITSETAGNAMPAFVSTICC
jgi:exodeoxyribonuclease III